MWYGTLFIVGMILSFLGGGLGDLIMFGISILFLIAGVVISRFEVRDQPIWIYGITFGFMWAGAMGGMTWPILRNTLPWVGIAIFLGFVFRLDQKIFGLLKKLKKNK